MCPVINKLCLENNRYQLPILLVLIGTNINLLKQFICCNSPSEPFVTFERLVLFFKNRNGYIIWPICWWLQNPLSKSGSGTFLKYINNNALLKKLILKANSFMSNYSQPAPMMHWLGIELRGIPGLISGGDRKFNTDFGLLISIIYYL